MKKKSLFIISFLLIFFSCDSKANEDNNLKNAFKTEEINKLLESIQLPEGFEIEIYGN